jgi:hypothetical protein
VAAAGHPVGEGAGQGEAEVGEAGGDLGSDGRGAGLLGRVGDTWSLSQARSRTPPVPPGVTLRTTRRLPELAVPPHVWSLSAIAAGYYEKLAAVRAGRPGQYRSPGDSGLDRATCRGQGPAVSYQAGRSGRALKQMHGLPSPAFDRLIELMAEVIEYPNDPVGTFPTNGFISGA